MDNSANVLFVFFCFLFDYGAVPEDELAVMAEAFVVFWVIIDYVHVFRSAEIC